MRRPDTPEYQVDQPPEVAGVVGGAQFLKKFNFKFLKNNKFFLKKSAGEGVSGKVAGLVGGGGRKGGGSVRLRLLRGDDVRFFAPLSLSLPPALLLCLCICVGHANITYQYMLIELEIL